MITSVYHFAPNELDETLKVLNAAITNHRAWFDRLHTSMLCGEPFPEDILNEAAHTQCQFGQWYYGDVSDTIRNFKEFSELEAVHKYMHDHARQLAKLCKQNKPVSVEDYRPFLDNQHHLIDLLNNLHDMLIEHQYCFDALTGAINRKSISLLLEQSFENMRRYGMTYSLAMLDADYFKKVNDQYGHMVGDQVLKNIATYLRKTLRKSDCVGRYGGEEFLIMLPETSLQKAFDVMDQCREGLAKYDMVTTEGTIHISVSIGVAELSKEDEDAWQTVKRADFALYKAKEEGRNCVVKSLG